MINGIKHEGAIMNILSELIYGALIAATFAAILYSIPV
jgi:hypothetical protein